MPIIKKKFGKRKRKISGCILPKNAPPFTGLKKFTNASRQRVRLYKGGVRRIFTPFHKFNQKKKIRMEFSRTLSPAGLSPKEKSYLICSCQAKSTKYAGLKRKAAEAIKEAKIFSIQGSCNAVRKALLDRGWVEKLPLNRMNLTKIRNGVYSNKLEIQSELERLLLSNFVDKHNPNFVWRSRDDRRETTIDMSKDYTTIVNKLELDAVWTSKQGLCSSMKRNYWFYIEDVAEVKGPRSYNTPEPGEIEGFIHDYKITACTSLLKWTLSMVANERPIFNDNGKIAINVIVFALNRCKEYLFRKQHKDIDREINTVNDEQWNSFLKKYYCIIARNEVFTRDKSNKLPLYLSYAKYLLKEIHKYRPQLSCEGCHNIWIIKPAHCSRGRGIRMASKLGVITDLLYKANAKHVIQKYIEEPLLIHETKFDIRQYYLVTSTYPLVIWMYRDCYLKFSSQKYNLKNYHESIHLTNNAVQKKYSNCKNRHLELPSSNMWDLNKYKSYLNKIGRNDVWDSVIYPGMKKSIVGIMLSCQDSLSVSKNRFELYGCDFILDNEYKPWLIEINSCPDLNSTTQVTAKICPAVLTDIIKVVIDYANNPKSSTGDFECIYRQPMTLPKYGSATDLVVRGYSLPNEYFYKGHIEIQESYEDPEIGSEQDVEAILNKLKRFYDMEDTVMVQTRVLDEKIAKKREKLSPSSLTENELSPVIDISNPSSQNVLKVESETSTPNLKSSNVGVQSVSSVTDLKPCKTNLKNSFSFSALDDGPLGKASFIEIKPKKKTEILKLCAIQETVALANKDPEFNLISTKQNDSVLIAASRLISFMRDKEKEYLNYS
ncbi:tubulin glycylase 3A-like isoform X2 [Pieris rapae]|uniref:tubulin glycylase 3A-like isoform X2 n=1 Tax=Pieris rapae TaxID=64459 RepID=UPI001E27E83E|nr:tubulin glycylase 3A-like isoform X2 [Pieris rapae]